MTDYFNLEDAMSRTSTRKKPVAPAAAPPGAGGEGPPPMVSADTAASALFGGGVRRLHVLGASPHRPAFAAMRTADSWWSSPGRVLLHAQPWVMTAGRSHR